MAEETDIIKKGLDVLVVLNTAVKNFHLYPPASASVVTAVEKLYQSLFTLLANDEQITFAESEKNLSISGHPLSSKEQEKPHIASLVGILTAAGLKSITFNKGLTKEELISFIDLVSSHPADLKREGGPGRLMSERNISHIVPDQHEPATIDKDSPLPSGPDMCVAEKPAEADTPPNKLLAVAEKFALRLNDERALQDSELMAMLPKIIEQLVAQKERQVLEDMLRRLVKNLESQNSEIRASAAKGLADTLSALPAGEKKDLLHFVSGNLLLWIKTETVLSDGYLKICGFLKIVMQDEMTQKHFSRALEYMEAFNPAAPDLAASTDAARKQFADILRDLASAENIGILLDEMNSADDQKRTEAGKVFSALGQTAVNIVLDQLRNTSEGDERVKMIHLITASKDQALPLVTARLKHHGEPWYYLRNLAYLLGHIGNEDSAPPLATLLRHENIKVRLEALKSIQRIGGTQRSSLLIAVMPQADDEFKAGLAEALGQIKSEAAVFPLLDLLKNRPLIPSAARTHLEEKICAALGAVGSPDAIPLLSEIAETKTFLGLNSYPDKVKSAAAKSLVILRRKVAESGDA